jgi:hypothetical protein
MPCVRRIGLQRWAGTENELCDSRKAGMRSRYRCVYSFNSFVSGDRVHTGAVFWGRACSVQGSNLWTVTTAEQLLLLLPQVTIEILLTVKE